MAINTSFQVSFGTGAADANAQISAELDDRDDGRNNGKTSFIPGEVAYFFVFKSDNVTYDPPTPSAGSVTGSGSESVEREEDITFANTDTANLSVPADNIVSVTWLGNSLGSLTLTGANTVKASATGVAVARVRYTATADVYGLQSPADIGGLTDYSILVFIQGRIGAAA